MVAAPRTPGGHGDAEDSGPVVAGLACEVEALHRKVEDLAGLSERVEELAELITRFAETTTSRACASSGAGAGGSGVASWLSLPGGEEGQALRLLGELAAWMDRIYLRYPDAAAALPECWVWHPDVVEELAWLMCAWRHAYETAEGAQAVTAAGDWHDRARPGVVRRIKAAAGMCSLENHEPDAPNHRPAETAPLVQAATQIAAWWAGDRTGTPPTPTAEQQAEARTRQNPGSRHR